MLAIRRTRTAVVCLLLVLLGACSRQHDSDAFSPTSPVAQAALEILNPGAISLPADGVSTVKIEAQISPDATVSRKLRFETTLGGWAEPASSTAAAQKVGSTTVDPKMVSRTADDTGKAEAFLRSGQTTGIALVTVSVVSETDANKVLTSENREVVFTEVTGALESFVVSADSAFVDDPPITLEAKISAGSPASWDVVVFTTTLGALDNSAQATEEILPVLEVTTDGDRIARAQLTSTKAGTATVTATIKDFEQATASRFATFNQRAPAISTDPVSLGFGQVAAGTKSSQILAVFNTGGQELEVTSAATNDPFKATLAETPLKIAPGGRGSITVEFEPATSEAAGPRSEVLNIASNDPLNRVLAVPLTAEVTKPGISVGPTQLAFGQVMVNAIADLVVTVTNTGSANLTIETATVTNGTGTDYSLVATVANQVVPPGGTFPMTVRFIPTATAMRSGALDITAKDLFVVTVQLTGEGI